MNYDTQAYISMLNKACEDWAEDHSAVQRLARLCGVSESEIHGGGYFVGIQPLVELCEQRVKAMQAGVIISHKDAKHAMLALAIAWVKPQAAHEAIQAAQRIGDAVELANKLKEAKP